MNQISIFYNKFIGRLFVTVHLFTFAKFFCSHFSILLHKILSFYIRFHSKIFIMTSDNVVVVVVVQCLYQQKVVVAAAAAATTTNKIHNDPKMKKPKISANSIRHKTILPHTRAKYLKNNKTQWAQQQQQKKSMHPSIVGWTFVSSMCKLGHFGHIVCSSASYCGT
jgi:hypothetical protein